MVSELAEDADIFNVIAYAMDLNKEASCIFDNTSITPVDQALFHSRMRYIDILMNRSKKMQMCDAYPCDDDSCTTCSSTWTGFPADPRPVEIRQTVECVLCGGEIHAGDPAHFILPGIYAGDDEGDDFTPSGQLGFACGCLLRIAEDHAQRSADMADHMDCMNNRTTPIEQTCTKCPRCNSNNYVNDDFIGTISCHHCKMHYDINTKLEKITAEQMTAAFNLAGVEIK